MSTHPPRYLPFDANTPSGICRFDGKVIPKGSRRRFYCDKACETEYLIRRLPGVAKREVWKRDRGICAVCGLDTKRVSKVIRAIWTQQKRSGTYCAAEFKRFMAMIGYPGRRFRRLWDVHHKLAVAEGGGGAPLSGLETRCIPCHRIATKELRGRLDRLSTEKRKVATKVRK